jgi:transposase
MGTPEHLPADGLEWRRFRALHLRQEGWPVYDIAEALDVSRVSVSRWLACVRDGGPDALRAHPSPGAPPKLSAAQKRLIPEFLWHGAEAYGFRGEVWTRARIAQVIEEEFGVRYHKGHVGKLLHELHWTPQVPIRRALQRDEEAIQRWRIDVWPELRQRARRERRVLVFEDESGFYLLPGLVRTYAPEAHTPVLREKQTRDHLSVMGGMTPEGKIYTLARQESLNGLHSVEFLQHLQRVAGERLLVV